jgi:RHS repeat-associated protein
MRMGNSDTQSIKFLIDELTYDYKSSTSNQLAKVTEGVNGNANQGFIDGNTTGDDYAYDANGNMIVDKNKNITNSIVYNHLNLPTKIIFPTGNIVYIYTASGQKMQKIVTNGTNTTTTDYLGGYQYQNTVLQFFPTAEGYVKNTPVSGTNSYSYVFNYTDHLGNVRISYTQNPSTKALIILDENNYYPFGLKHTPYNAIAPAPEYKYKYNGKELQDENIGGNQLNLYDFGARNYDPALGRWMNVDPLAEKFPAWSPYSFCFDNPLKFIDLDGKEPTDHWQLNKLGKLVLIKKTNDNFNVFFDETGKKLFQTNEMSKEMTTKAWEGKGDEYQNKLVTTFINIAEQKNVFTTMVERSKETGFDTKLGTLDKMKEVGETYKANGPAQGFLEMAREMPKFATGNIFASSGPNSFLTQGAKSIYTGINGTNIMKDAKLIFNQGVENTKTFFSDLKTEWNNGMSKLSQGIFGN